MPYWRKNRYCVYQIHARIANDSANAGMPCRTETRPENVLGTSSETTSSVTAKPNAQSANPSTREMSAPRLRKPAGGGGASLTGRMLAVRHRGTYARRRRADG